MQNDYPNYNKLPPNKKEKIEQLLIEIEQHQPWNWEGGVWKTEASYWSFIRGNFRQIWKTWPIKINYMKKKTYFDPVFDDAGEPVLYKSGKKIGTQKTQKCFICEVFKKKVPCSKNGKINYETDHIAPAGSLTNGLEACIFLFRLLTSSDNMRLISKEAHAIITHMERTGLSWEEASLDKQVIDKLKQKVDDQKSELLSYGFTEEDVSNKDKRKSCYIKHLKK